MTDFDHGKALATSVIDYQDAMRADIGKFILANIETHCGYWCAMVNRLHKARIERPTDTYAQADYRRAQAGYNAVTSWER